jgi:hypothetical protein
LARGAVDAWEFRLQARDEPVWVGTEFRLLAKMIRGVEQSNVHGRLLSKIVILARPSIHALASPRRWTYRVGDNLYSLFSSRACHATCKL